MLSRLEVDVITELWPVDVLQEAEVMLSSRCTRVICLHLYAPVVLDGCSVYCRGSARMCSLVMRSCPSQMPLSF